jgi:hypothetical protein
MTGESPAPPMSTQLKSELITLRKSVPGFTGVGTLVEEQGDLFVIVCADAATLAATLTREFPNFAYDPEMFQKMTIIQTK